jgi:hypothetical protein
MFEPLLIGFVFPFVNCSPWQLRSTPKMRAMERQMRRLHKTGEMDGGPVLRKFLVESERLPTLPEVLVRKLLYFEQ